MICPICKSDSIPFITVWFKKDIITCDNCNTTLIPEKKELYTLISTCIYSLTVFLGIYSGSWVIFFMIFAIGLIVDIFLFSNLLKLTVCQKDGILFTNKRKSIKANSIVLIIITIFCAGCILIDIVGRNNTIQLEKDYKPPPCDCETDTNYPCKINGVCLRFNYDPNLYFSYGVMKNCNGQQFDLGNVPRVAIVVEEFIKRYNSEIIRNNLTDIYILDSFECFGSPRGGMFFSTSIYIDIKPFFTDQWVLSTLHHEFSSILKRNYPFPEQEWRSINNNSFNYTHNVLEVLKQPDNSQLLSSSLEEGFLQEYARTTIDNDFNTVAEWMFTRETELCEIRGKHDRIDKKVELALKFYKSIGSGVDFFECKR